MKLKNILCAAVLSVAVAIVFCGCGNETEKSKETGTEIKEITEKSKETGIEIKKISEEEVYELLARVEEKANKIEAAHLSMDQGFQEKWDLLKRKQSAADRAFSQKNFDATSKFLQEAESAADWILTQGPLRAEADEQMRAASDAKKVANIFFAQESRYYREAVQYVHQGSAAYEQGDFEEAVRSFRSAAASFQQALRDFVPYYFVKVEAGSFKRGEQQVTLTKDFYIGKYEVTQAQYQLVMGNNPSKFSGANRPVERIHDDDDNDDAMAFCEKLNNSGLAPRYGFL